MKAVAAGDMPKAYAMWQKKQDNVTKIIFKP